MVNMAKHSSRLTPHSSLSLGDTAIVGQRLAALLFPGAVVALIGPLGAGKTHFVRAVVEGLGGDGRQVSSPTFALIHEYNARLPVYHFDTYRLPNEAALSDLGVGEYFDGDGVCLVEWADRVEGVLPTELLRLTIEVTGETTRRFNIEARGTRYNAIVSALSRSV
ncbi:MAG TPA: tRNA (adenosine(37)-N6)-threonylcarbamoyltransferase complex ATPase subunit type 1 TsaE [Gemmataceae bacterium]|jgi:tRNA threonylcarbamoyladenosine biosynthesis protein TsaE|nr:tRNA (adenosine(37)-N6)-threonylcarbamoyltransferase complex ATPase subunit type 1 TsaE [Gemmataceae bacterium]